MRKEQKHQMIKRKECKITRKKREQNAPKNKKRQKTDEQDPK